MTELDNSNDESGKYAPGVNRNARLVVRNLPWTATEESVRKHFESYGELEEVKLLRRPDGKLVGCGFVHYKLVPMANKALVATNKKSFMGRPLHVSWALSKHKYEEKLKSEEDGKGDKKQKRKHSESNDFEVVIKEEDIKTETDVKKEKVRLNRNARLIIRNISFKATEESLREFFQPYGDIHEVKLLKKPDGKLVGCAFVHYKNVPMAKKALLNTNMKPFLGRPISVDWAVAKDKYMQHMEAQRLELEDHVKKEDSDGGDVQDVKHDLNATVKSESEDSDDETKPKVKDEDSDDDDEDDDEEDDDEEDDDLSDDGIQASQTMEKKRIQLNDAEDGRTVFIKNLSFGVDDDKLREFVERTAPVDYALVCVDKLTEHSKGSAFVKFKNEEDASRFMSLPAPELTLEGQTMEPCPALTRDHVGKEKKQSKDNRNLYLVKEGVIVAGTKAAVGVSASDMAKRLALERSKTQMLKNLNRFVSRYRLVVSNLPAHYDDGRLRALVTRTVARAAVTECRVMRDLRAPIQHDGKHPSKGFGFVMFTKTEDALACLRKLNNNPDAFDKNNRPIVSFSIEDRTALNARKKRLEKSIANNPTNKKNDSEEGFKMRKRKNKDSSEDNVKRPKFEKNKAPKNKSKKFETDNDTPGKFVKRPNLNEDIESFAGLTSKKGSKHTMRTGHKLKSQADIHRQNVKLEKKNSKKKLKLKMAMKERIKQPKMKINKNPKGNKNKETAVKIPKQSFDDIKNKYKTKLVSGNSLERVKAKWYE